MGLTKLQPTQQRACSELSALPACTKPTVARVMLHRPGSNLGRAQGTCHTSEACSHGCSRGMCPCGLAALRMPHPTGLGTADGSGCTSVCHSRVVRVAGADMSAPSSRARLLHILQPVLCSSTTQSSCAWHHSQVGVHPACHDNLQKNYLPHHQLLTRCQAWSHLWAHQQLPASSNISVQLLLSEAPAEARRAPRIARKELAT